MSPADALLLSWRVPVVPSFALLLTAGIYLRGWRRVRKSVPKRFEPWRMWCFLGGLTALFVAIASPLDAFAGMLLQAHMVQHLLLTMLAPPLLLLGNPMLPMLRGLPRRFARNAIGPFLIWPPLKRFAAFLTHPIVAWLLFQLCIVLWHLPPMYELALRNPGWHEVEHAAFLGTGLLFWWFIVRPWPSHQQRPLWWTIPYLLFADLCNTGLAAFLSFYDQVLYPTYAVAPRLWGISALDDQAGAGAIMWVPGSAAYLIPVGILCARLLQGRKGVRPSEYLNQPKAAIPQPAKTVSLPLLTKPVLLALAGGMRWLFLALAIAVIVDGLLGPSLSPLNLAGVLPWTYWRGVGVIALLLLGNLFCLSCPMMLVRNLWRKWLPARLEWPRMLRNKWPAAGLLLLFLWSYEAFALWDRPYATAWLVVGYFGAILLVDGLFRGASFCKYVCPVGQYHFVMSMISPATIRAREPAACLSCTTHDCIKGNAKQNGCELKLFVPRKSGNADCTLCLDCVKACSKDNVILAPALPSDDWQRSGPRSGVGNYARRPDFAALIALLVFGAFFNSAGMLAPVLAWEDHLVAGGINREWLLLGLAIGTMLILPGALGWLLGAFSRWAGALALRPLEVASRFAPTLVPIGAAMWASHFLFHLLTGLWTIQPAAQRVLGQKPQGISSGLAGGWIQGFEVLLLDLGLLFSWYGIWRISKSLGIRRGSLATAPWLALVLGLWILGLWIVFQPMQMRGTMGAIGH